MAARSREALKAIAHGVALVAVTPALLSFWIRSFILGRDRALEHSTQAFGLVPGLIGQYLRRAFLRRTLAYCDPSALIEFGTIFSAAGTRIDAHVYLGPYCAIGLVHFEHDVMVAPAVQIPSGRLTHGISDPTTPMRDQAGRPQLVRIGAGTWIGGAAVVMADVGANTIVGAGAVVTKALPSGVVAGGVPARVLSNRDESAGASSGEPSTP
jgi:acetyltransferase-like isoleucine patch superfamily enzyme